MIGRLLALTAVLAVSTLSATADTVPKLNVEPSCRAAARMGDSMDAKLQDCMREEQTARAKLENDWTQFSFQEPHVMRFNCHANTHPGELCRGSYVFAIGA